MNRNGIILLIIIGGIILLSIGGMGYTYSLYRETKLQLEETKKAESPVQSSQPANDQTTINAVEKHILLPNETPKVVTLSDVETLKKTQPFFLKASNGDKILVYTDKVILYSTFLDRILDIAYIKQDTSKPVIVTTPPPVFLTPTP
jgi:hypothetical protein